MCHPCTRKPKGFLWIEIYIKTVVLVVNSSVVNNQELLQYFPASEYHFLQFLNAIDEAIGWISAKSFVGGISDGK